MASLYRFSRRFEFRDLEIWGILKAWFKILIHEAGNLDPLYQLLVRVPFTLRLSSGEDRTP